jgi:hypothetical protein
MQKFAALLFVVPLMALAACGSGTTTQTGISPSAGYNPGSRPSSPAGLSFVQPQNNAVVPAGVVHIQLQLEGATIVSQTTTHITPTTGHIHFSINDKLFRMNYSTVQDLPLQKGLYKLTAEFVAADHFPFNPRVTTTIVVSVQ